VRRFSPALHEPVFPRDPMVLSTLNTAMRTMFRPWIGVLLLCLAPAARAGVLLEPRPAPEWKCSEWLNGNPGALANNRGKVVIIHFFQMWCPVCNAFTIPLLERWEQKYADRSDVMLVSVHSVFEGYEAQTPELLKVFVKDKGIRHPVCIDAYPAPGAETPVTMEAFDAGGTPHVAIVDKQGLLRFSHFGRFDPKTVEFFIGRLADEKGVGTSTVKGGSGGKLRGVGRNKPPAPANPVQSALPTPAGISAFSGTYKVVIEQLAKSCGPALPPTDVIAEITVTEASVEARFTRPVLGLTQVKADYDTALHQFQTDLTEKTKDNDVALDVNLSVRGGFQEGAGEPTVEFRFSFGMRSEDGTADCAIEGRGEGTRLRGR
jgi:thiol-disulfide isomerase/thioredoxin